MVSIHRIRGVNHVGPGSQGAISPPEGCEFYSSPSAHAATRQRTKDFNLTCLLSITEAFLKFLQENFLHGVRLVRVLQQGLLSLWSSFWWYGSLVAPSKRFTPRYATGIIQRCLDSLQGFKFARIFYTFLAGFLRHTQKYQGNESSQKVKPLQRPCQESKTRCARTQRPNRLSYF